ncbi:MAG: polynucleotide kinase-phosphatase [Verrucomicrobiales bacterium]
MKISIPELALVVLIGPSGSGKSTFARRLFKPTEVISSDYCRGLVSDDENNQAATKEAFEVLHFIASKRLQAGKLTVIDATNVQPESRKPLIALARQFHCLPVALVLNTPERVCHERNKQRTDRNFGPHVVRQQIQQLRKSFRGLQREGFRHVYKLEGLEDIDSAVIVREPLWTNLSHEHGPFDIIGDVHGCFEELVELLVKLGYTLGNRPDGVRAITPPNGRKAVFLGDLVDRGPKVPQTLKLVMAMVEDGAALCVPGNHDIKLLKKLRGKNVQVKHGLAETIAQMEKEGPEFQEKVAQFIDDLVSHYVLDRGNLVVAHAGMKEEMQGRGSGAVREFALYGETTGEIDEFGLPVRYNWAAEYRGKAMVVYGHTPVPEAEWLNRTINIDTGCVFGGKLTALRYPENELIAVPAKQIYAESVKPFLPVEPSPSNLSAQHLQDDCLDMEDVLGKRIIGTRLHYNITIREENAIAALEVMSRFAANPKWLIYLPPTMSPSATSQEPALLEHPAEAFGYYREEEVGTVICEEKHMGSRAVVIVCRDAGAVRRRFGVIDEGIGIIYTRTGRHFFDDSELEQRFLHRIQEGLSAANFWKEFETDWFCLDCELMPWSAKAQDLVKHQYAAVGSAGTGSVVDALQCLTQAADRGLQVDSLLERKKTQAVMIQAYSEAYRRYCWPIHSLDDFRLAPFHILASEGKVHTGQLHTWHMQWIAKLSEKAAPFVHATPYLQIDLQDTEQIASGIRWWEELTAKGGEGMVVKPLGFITRGKKGIVQPAIKCRGQEYLRIIYGPEYTAPENLGRLRSRSLHGKRSLALREFALGMEGLERFVRNEPLRRVHECVFGVLALESEPVDPRL